MIPVNIIKQADLIPCQENADPSREPLPPEITAQKRILMDSFSFSFFSAQHER